MEGSLYYPSVETGHCPSEEMEDMPAEVTPKHGVFHQSLALQRKKLKSERYFGDLSEADDEDAAEIDTPQSPKDAKLLALGEVLDLGAYFDYFGVTDKERVTMCRGYASYVASIVKTYKK